MIETFNPDLYNSYINRKNKYFQNIEKPSATKEAKVSNAVKILQRDGICVIENYVERNKALGLGLRLMALLGEVEAGTITLENTVHRFDEIGLIRLLDAHKINDELKGFFEDRYIENTMKVYASSSIKSRQRMLEWRKGINKHGPADGYHIDEGYYHKCKAFLYLTDVTETTAPFDYYVGSHLDAIWRTPKEVQMHLWETRGSSKVFGLRGNFFESREIFEITKQFNYTHKVCVGRAGTLILVDARGIHKATTPQTGGRLMLGNYFEVPRTALCL